MVRPIRSVGRATSPPRTAAAGAWSVAFAKELLRGTDTQPGIKKSMRATPPPVAGRPLGLANLGREICESCLEFSGRVG